MYAMEAAHGEYAAGVQSDTDLRTYFNIGSFHSGVWVGAPSPRAEAKIAMTLVPSDKTAAFVDRCMKMIADAGAEAEVLLERACIL